MDPSPESVRPRTSDKTTMSSGLGNGVAVGDDSDDGGCIASAGGEPKRTAGVFPVGEMDGQINTHECQATAEEEEQAACPPCLPSPYQPTRIEYLEHCVTHFPFRAWCRHCLESRGREFGHSHTGSKDPGLLLLYPSILRF